METKRGQCRKGSVRKEVFPWLKSVKWSPRGKGGTGRRGKLKDNTGIPSGAALQERWGRKNRQTYESRVKFGTGPLMEGPGGKKGNCNILVTGGCQKTEKKAMIAGGK